MKITFNPDSASVQIALQNGCTMVQDRHPQTNAPVTTSNFEEVAQACVSDSDWAAHLKLKGSEVLGVMCSATKEDQAGLSAVLLAFQLQGTAFTPTEFSFSNGNRLTLTKDNMAQFIATWLPFRQSFFAMS